MRSLRWVLGLTVAGALAGGCTPDFDGDEEAADESAVKKKINPQGTEGTFHLAKPEWATPAFDEGLTFAGKAIKLGDSLKKPPGDYPLLLGASKTTIVVKASETKTTTPAGIIVRYAKPVQPVWFAKDQIIVATIDYQNHVIRTGAAPVNLAVVPNSFRVTGTSFSWENSVAAGSLTELVMPTAAVTVNVDPIDAAYPSAQPDCLRLRTLRNDIDIFPNYSASRYSVSPPLRDIAGTSVNVPAGNTVRLATGGSNAGTNGAELATWPVVEGTTTSITIHRLEVNDVANPDPSGEDIRGAFSVEMKRNGSFVPYACASGLPTHTGVDLPDGSYRVTTLADGPSGRITYVEEISFP